jgi:hypothetical protein
VFSGAWVEETNCQSFGLIRIVVLGTEEFPFLEIRYSYNEEFDPGSG